MKDKIKDIQKAFIGACLFAPSYYFKVNDTVTPEMIKEPVHRKIYEVLSDYYTEHQSRDFTLIASMVDNEKVTASYLRQLSKGVNHGNIEIYAKQIKEAYHKETFVSLLNEAQLELPTEDIDTIFSKLEDNFKKLIESQSDKSAHISHSTEEALKFIYNAREFQVSGIDTGYHDFNCVSGGFQPGDQLVLAARPGMGKTTLMLNHLLHVARQGVPVVLFSMEMPKIQINQLLASIITGISTEDFRSGHVTDQDMEKIEDAFMQIRKLPIFLYDSVNKIDQIIPIVKHLKRKVRIRMVFIDYLQLIQGNEKLTRNSQLEQISGKLKQLALSEGITNVILAQLNRSVETRTNKRPLASDLRDSGSIEQDCDILALLYRESYYYPDSEDDKTEILIRKNRMGRICTLLRRFENRKFIEA